MADIITVDDLLALDLCIPNYQRPYKWTIQNVSDLLGDITDAIKDYDQYGSSFKYRIGTILVYENNEGVLEVIDGQQRIITLTLIRKCIDPSYSNSILNNQFNNKETQANIRANYTFIREWFSLKESSKADVINAYSNILQTVIIYVSRLSEAFQLFDSQNNRGKELDPHDLLKAYHLREMVNYPYEMRRAVTKWEEHDTSAIKILFSNYLYDIWNWSRGKKTHDFKVKDIDTYKGVNEGSYYTYARRASKAMPYFQITEPFVAGNDFFEMVDHYLNLLEYVKKLGDDDSFGPIKEILASSDGNKGFDHTKNLFYCVLLCYYDKFHNFDEMAVKKLFLWSFMIRMDIERLGFDTINNYAIGGDDYRFRYTNKISMFSVISSARKHTEIAGIPIKTQRDSGGPAAEKWRALYNQLNMMNGVEVAR